MFGVGVNQNRKWLVRNFLTDSSACCTVVLVRCVQSLGGSVMDTSGGSLVIDLFTPAEDAAVQRADKLVGSIEDAGSHAFFAGMAASLVMLVCLLVLVLPYSQPYWQALAKTYGILAVEYVLLAGLPAIMILPSVLAYFLIFRPRKVRKEAQLRELLLDATLQIALKKLDAMVQAHTQLAQSIRYTPNLLKRTLAARLEKYRKGMSGQRRTSFATGV